MVDVNPSVPRAGEHMFVHLGAPPEPDAAVDAPMPAGLSCFEVEMRDGLLWIVSPDVIDTALRDRIEHAQREGMPLFVIEGTVICQGTDGEPRLDVERSQVLSSFTARHLRTEDGRGTLHRHV